MISRVPVIAGMSVMTATLPAVMAAAIMGGVIEVVAAQRAGVGAWDRSAHQKNKKAQRRPCDSSCGSHSLALHQSGDPDRFRKTVSSAQRMGGPS
jgi:hypothetical protein